MKPTKLSARVFFELPGLLARYLEGGKNHWLESVPAEGKLHLLNRPGVFSDLESMAVERRHFLEILGFEHARALTYRMAFEQGRRDAARHFALFGQNARLALQAGPVFRQLQGRFTCEMVTFEFDLEARTLYREVLLHANAEALMHRLLREREAEGVCWGTAGYISGHVSEVLGVRVITLETECMARGDEACRFISRLDPEWGEEAAWARHALRLQPFRLGHEEPAASAAPAAVAEEAVRPATPTGTGLDALVAESVAMQSVVRRARQIAPSEVGVLIAGEVGSGCSMLARAIHAESLRRDGPFCPVDCLGLSPDALAMEVFGAPLGRSQGCAAQRAHGGTLYLSEITRMPLDAQGALTQLIEHGEFLPAGSESPVEADVRIIAATHYDPAESLQSGALREELYYALTVGKLVIPPLRERDLDILRLAEQFLREFAERHARRGLSLGEDARNLLQSCPWPGNVRQLRNAVEHAVLFARESTIAPTDFPEDIALGDADGPRELTRDVILAVLRKARGNRSRAAELLGVGRTTLWRAMRRFEIE